MHRLVPWLVAAAIVLALGVPWLSPVRPFYATSDSMAPTIESGDLYFVLETSSVGTGDVIAYESPARGVVTHRVVAVGNGGFVTRGDANPSTDQAAGTPLVDRSAVIGRVVTLGGRSAVLPGAGSWLSWAADHRIGLGAIGLVLLVASSILGRGARVRSRDVLYVGDLIVPLVVGGVLVAGFLVAWGSSTHDVTFVATQGAATAAKAIPVGEPAVRTVSVDVATPPFSTALVETEGMALLDRSVDGTAVTLRVELPAVGSPGPYAGRVHVAAYPATLPRSVLADLHAVHPLVALAGSLAPLFGPLAGCYLVLFDGREPVRTGPGWLPRLRRGGLGP